MSHIVRDSSVLKIADGIDINGISLSAQEGFILSRIDGKLQVREIYQLSFLDKTATASVLKKLIDSEILEFVTSPEEEAKIEEKGNLPQREYGQFIFNLVELQEEVDISEELKKNILFTYDKMDDWNYYEVLNIPDTADAKEVKKAFLKLSKIYHPDSYFRKNLGSFSQKISQIYGRLATAQSTLIDPRKRAEYRRNLIEDGVIDPMPGDILEDPIEREKRKKKDHAKSRALRNPMLKRVQKAKQFYEAGEADMKKQAWISAANNFKFAMTYDPHNELYKAKADLVKDQANKAAAEKIFQKATMLESYGQDGYFEMYIRAAETHPTGAEFNIKVAKLYWDQSDYRDALPYAKRAANSDPNNSEYNLLLGQIYLKVRDKENAAKQFERVLKVQPDNEMAKSMLKESKKWF